MIPFIITIVVDFIVGLIAFSNRKNPIARSLGLFIICFGMWQTELYLLKAIDDVNTLSQWFHLTRIGMFLLPFFLAKITWQICGTRSTGFRNLVLFPTLFIAVALGLLNNTYIPSILIKGTTGFLPVPDTIYYIFLSTLLYALIATGGHVVGQFQRTTVRKKRRLIWVMATLVLAVVVSVASVVVFLSSTDAYLLSVVGAIGNILFLGLLLYSTVNYHSYDIAPAISSLLAHLLVLALITTLLFMGQSAIDQSNEHLTFAQGPIVLKVLLFTVLISLYPMALHICKPITMKLIVKRALDHQLVKRQAHTSFKNSLTNDDLAVAIDGLVLNTLGLTHYRLFIVNQSLSDGKIALQLYDGKAYEELPEGTLITLKLHQGTVLMQDEVEQDLSDFLKSYNSIALCPLWLEEQLIGLLCLGPSTINRNAYYRYDEIRVLELITRELPQTIPRIARFNDTKAELDNANKTLSIVELMNQYQHEIKAPLSIIEGVLSNDLYDWETQRDIVLRQVSRGTQLVNMMNRVLSEKPKPQLKPLDISPLAQECALLFESNFKTIAYKARTLPRILGDKDELTILLINIFKNSAEAKHPDRPLKLMTNAYEAGGLVWLEISDTGQGMEEKQISGLWGSRNKSTKTTGAGIGLRVVHRIAQEHGAKIEVTSHKDLGTTFRFGFPALASR